MIAIKHRFLKRALFISLLLSMVVLGTYLAKAKPAAIIAALSRINPVLLAVGVAIVLLSWVLEGFRVFLIADALGERMSIWHMIRINIATAFSGNVVPIASMAAPTTHVFLLTREGIPVGRATAIVAVRTASSTLFFTITAPILFLGFGRTFINGITTNLALSVIIQLVLIVSSVVALTTLAILLRPGLGPRLTKAIFSLRFVKRVLGSNSEQVAERVARESNAFHESMVVLMRSKKDAVFIVALTIIYWAMYFSVAPLLLLGVGIPLTIQGTLQLVAFVFMAFFLLSYLPIPTGSGVSELSFGSILVFFGIPDPIRTVILVVWSFLCVQIYTLVGGAFFLGSLRKRKREAGEAVTATEPSAKET